MVLVYVPATARRCNHDLQLTIAFAGMFGHLLQPIFAPLGFNWQICIALIPAMAAREVVVAALGTVYALSAVDEDACPKVWSL